MSNRRYRVYMLLLVLCAIGLTYYILLTAQSYYETPLTFRRAHPLHAKWKPSGIIGHGLGIAGSLFMLIGVILYSSRKRLRFLAFTGQIRLFLGLHIFLCLTGPIMVSFHTTFKFGGIVAVSYWCMVIVVLSGIGGRYLYQQIPRTMSGQELTKRDLELQNKEMAKVLEETYSLTDTTIIRVKKVTQMSMPHYPGFLFPIAILHMVWHSIYLRLRLWSLLREKEFRNVRKGLVKHLRNTVIQKAKLERKLNSLEVSRRLFLLWHLFHLPFAIIMFIIMLIHITVAWIFGYRWIF